MRAISNTSTRPHGPIRQRLLSFVEVLEIQAHGFQDYMCADIGKLCRNLKVMYVKLYEEDNGLCGLSEQCGCLPIEGQNVKLLVYSYDSPTPTARSGFTCRQHRLASRDAPDFPVPHAGRCGSIPECVNELVIEFCEFDRNVPRHCLSNAGKLETLTLRFAPLNQYYELEERYDFLNSNTVNNPEDWRYIQDERLDLPEGSRAGYSLPAEDTVCGQLAMACMTADPKTKIQVVNIDQIPLWPKDVAITSKRSFLRNHNGNVRFVRPVPNALPDDPQFEAVHVYGKELEAGEQALEERVELVKGTTKRWIEALLRSKGLEETFEDKWNNVSFITMKEYRDLPAHRIDWNPMERCWGYPLLV